MDSQTMSGGRSDITIPAMPLIHTGFALSTVVLCVVVWSLRATSYFGDALEAQYWAACAFAAMSFGVGTLMVELFRGDIVGASLGRVLVGLSVLIMAAKAHEFMEQAQECWIANVQQAKPVEYMPVSYVREIEHNGMRVSYETKREPRDGRFWSVQSVLGSCAGANGSTAGSDGGGDTVRGGAQRRSTAATDGTNAF